MIQGGLTIAAHSRKVRQIFIGGNPLTTQTSRTGVDTGELGRYISISLIPAWVRLRHVGSD